MGFSFEGVFYKNKKQNSFTTTSRPIESMGILVV